MSQISSPLQQLRLPPVTPRPWRFRDFPILAWWAPPGTASEADFWTYKDAGFTLCTVNSDADYARALEMAARVRLPVMAYRQCQGFSGTKPDKAPDFT